MVFGILLTVGALLGVVIGALSSPAVFRWVFGGPADDADHDDPLN